MRTSVFGARPFLFLIRRIRRIRKQRRRCCGFAHQWRQASQLVRSAQRSQEIGRAMTEKKKKRDERWGSYPETVLTFAGETEVMVDLREPLSPATKKGLAAIGLGEPFSVLTAFNPRGVDLSEEKNASRMEALEAELRSSGDEFV